MFKILFIELNRTVELDNDSFSSLQNVDSSSQFTHHLHKYIDIYNDNENTRRNHKKKLALETRYLTSSFELPLVLARNLYMVCTQYTSSVL